MHAAAHDIWEANLKMRLRLVCTLGSKPQMLHTWYRKVAARSCSGKNGLGDGRR